MNQSRTVENAPNAASALAIQDVVKTFKGEYALRGVSLDLRDGECVTLLGPSGSGKTTLLKVIAGFETATSGSVSFQGRQITGLSPAERDCGMVFQNYALFPHMTVRENIAYGLKLRHWKATAVRSRVDEMLDLVELSGYAARYPRQLSGGQQQRVAIARALAYDPPILLMDEPLGALDRSLRLDMVEQIRRIHRETKKTIVYVTHDQQEALALSDRIAIMRDGAIVEVDTPERLYRRPETSFVATFFGSSNLVSAQIVGTGESARARCLGSEFPFDAPEGDVTLAVRPRVLGLSRAGETRRGLRVTGIVVDALLLGDEYEVIVEVPAGGTTLKVLLQALAEDLVPGHPVELFAPADEIRLVRD